MKVFSIEHSKSAYFVDFAVYLAAIVLLPLFLVHFALPQVWAQIALSVVAGMAIWSLIEYAMHRFVFHGIEPFQRMHAEHHRRPQALIATPTVLSLALILVLVWLPATLLGGFCLAGGHLGSYRGLFRVWSHPSRRASMAVPQRLDAPTQATACHPPPFSALQLWCHPIVVGPHSSYWETAVKYGDIAITADGCRQAA